MVFIAVTGSSEAAFLAGMVPATNPIMALTAKPVIIFPNDKCS